MKNYVRVLALYNKEPSWEGQDSASRIPIFAKRSHPTVANSP